MSEILSIQTGYADVNGSKFYYETAGSGQPLVLVHGVGVDSRTWDGQFTELAQHFRVIRLDLRGFGKTTASAESYTFYGDLRGVLQALEIDNASFIGHSFGGYAVIEYALRYPGLVDKLVLINASLLGHPRTDELQAYIAASGSAMQSSGTEAVIDLSLRNWCDGPGQPEDRVPQDVRDRYREIASYAHYLPPLTTPPTWLEPNPITCLEDIQAPVLAVSGELDFPDFPEIAEVIVSRAKNARHVQMTGAAHLPHLERPAEFNQLVLDFLK